MALRARHSAIIPATAPPDSRASASRNSNQSPFASAASREHAKVLPHHPAGSRPVAASRIRESREAWSNATARVESAEWSS